MIVNTNADAIERFAVARADTTLTKRPDIYVVVFLKKSSSFLSLQDLHDEQGPELAVVGVHLERAGRGITDLAGDDEDLVQVLAAELAQREREVGGRGVRDPSQHCACYVSSTARPQIKSRSPSFNNTSPIARTTIAFLPNPRLAGLYLSRVPSEPRKPTTNPSATATQTGLRFKPPPLITTLTALY